MPRKTSVRKSNYSKDDKARRSTPKKLPYDRMESSRSYSEEIRRERVRPRQTAKRSRDDLSRKVGRSEYQESHQKNRGTSHRQMRERRRREEYRGRKQQVPTKNPRMMVFSFISNLVFYGVTIGIILMAVMFSFSSKSTASIFGYRFYTVLTNSMVPQENGPKGGFYAGDIVIVRLMDGNKVEKNDVVTFAVGDGSRYLTHRMVERKDELNGEKGDYLITKGDANKSNDPPITADRVLGKVVVAVPKAGSIIEFVREEFWACLVCILSLYGFFLVLKAYLFSPDEQSFRKGRDRRRLAYER